MLDFGKVPVIDNHSHPFDLEKVTLDADSLAKVFFHGMGDIPKDGVKKAKLWGTTDELRYHLRHMGVIQTMVCQLSKLLGCQDELEVVAAERNRRTRRTFRPMPDHSLKTRGLSGRLWTLDCPGRIPSST